MQNRNRQTVTAKKISMLSAGNLPSVREKDRITQGNIRMEARQVLLEGRSWIDSESSYGPRWSIYRNIRSQVWDRLITLAKWQSRTVGPRGDDPHVFFLGPSAQLPQQPSDWRVNGAYRPEQFLRNMLYNLASMRVTFTRGASNATGSILQISFGNEAWIWP